MGVVGDNGALLSCGVAGLALLLSMSLPGCGRKGSPPPENPKLKAPPTVSMQSRPPPVRKTRPLTEDPVPLGDEPEEKELVPPPEAAGDPSLTTRQYELYGVPNPDRVWGPGDYSLALKGLKKLSGQDPRLLPRAGSPKSGEVFGRLTAPENLAVLAQPALPRAQRLSAAKELQGDLSGIRRLYEGAASAQMPFSQEIRALRAQEARLSKILRAL